MLHPTLTLHQQTDTHILRMFQLGSPHWVPSVKGNRCGEIPLQRPYVSHHLPRQPFSYNGRFAPFYHCLAALLTSFFTGVLKGRGFFSTTVSISVFSSHGSSMCIRLNLPSNFCRSLLTSVSHNACHTVITCLILHVSSAFLPFPRTSGRKIWLGTRWADSTISRAVKLHA